MEHQFEFINNRSASGDLGDYMGFDFSSGDPELSHILLRFSATVLYVDKFSLKEAWFNDWEGM